MSGLTADQRSWLDASIQEWRKIGLSCDPADFSTGDRIIKSFYKRIGEREPEIRHFESPSEMINHNFLTETSEHIIGLNQNLINLFHKKLTSHYCFKPFGFRLTADQSIRAQYVNNTFTRSRLNAQLIDGFYGRLFVEIYRHISSAAHTRHAYWFGGQHWCADIALCLAAHELVHPNDDIKLLHEWAELAKSIGWWMPYQDMCLVSDRPRHVSFDQNRQLHSETGKAVEYSDGWGVSSWHGLTIPHRFIKERDTITVTQIKRENNAEFRRVLVDLYGRERFLADSGAVLVSADEHGRLWESRHGFQRPREHFVEVENATIEHGVRRKFFMRVPTEITTAHAAVAWTFGLSPDDYSLMLAS